MPILFALSAILLWSTLALLGAGLSHLPPLLLLGVAFAPSGIYSLFSPRAWHIPPLTLAVGVGGIFGYHFLYFSAFALAPAIEANLINYLWPLLIVMLSPLILRGYRLGAHHILGALMGLAGAALIVTNGHFGLNSTSLPGYLYAAGAALTWALYSLFTKRLPPFPTESVAAFCAISSLLAFSLHILTGGSFSPLAHWPPVESFYLLLAGLGPMGAAFFFWDAALKRGDPRAIGSLAYLTPLLSTLNLVLLAGKPLTVLNFGAMLLIIAGALIGSLKKGTSAMTLTLAQIIDLTGQHGQGWAVPHARRVIALARQIAGKLKPDWLALEYAAFLHDWGAFPRYLLPGVSHALRSRQVAESEILPHAGLPTEQNLAILQAIELHDYRDTRPPSSPEALLLREADFLDFLGAIGVVREYAWGPNNLRTCLERAVRRKDLLAARLTLPAAQEIAAVRLARMDQILAWLEEESAGDL